MNQTSILQDKAFSSQVSPSPASASELNRLPCNAGKVSFDFSYINHEVRRFAKSLVQNGSSGLKRPNQKFKKFTRYDESAVQESSLISCPSSLACVLVKLIRNDGPGETLQVNFWLSANQVKRLVANSTFRVSLAVANLVTRFVTDRIDMAAHLQPTEFA